MSYLCHCAAVTILRRGQASQLVSRVEYMVPDQQVEEERARDANPDEHIVGVNSNVVPFTINPAPDLREEVSPTPLRTMVYVLAFRAIQENTHCCTTVHWTFALLTDKEQGECDDEGTPVADDAVNPPPSPKRVGTRAKVEDEEDIYCHRQ